MTIEQVRDCLLIGEVSLYELKARALLETRQSVLFEPHVVVIVEIVEPDDFFTALQQTVGNMKANEARRPSNENTRHPLQFSPPFERSPIRNVAFLPSRRGYTAPLRVTTTVLSGPVYSRHDES